MGDIRTATAAGERKFFFLHVMKTAGGTLRRAITANFDRPQVYPFGQFDPDLQLANYDLAYLTSLPSERRRQIRVFTGHFPFVAIELLGMELTTFTLLRDPIERTLSYLRHCQYYHEQHRDLSLEEIYEDRLQFECFIRNHQAKLFAFTAADRPRSYMDVLDVDARRLEIAKENLQRVDLIGFQDDFDSFREQLEREFGWRMAGVKDKHVLRRQSVASSFRRRIARDNAADLEFFEYARELTADRCERNLNER